MGAHNPRRTGLAAVKARFTIGNTDYQIVEIQAEEFDEIMKNESVRDLIGLPTVFDENGRLWPMPRKGLKVEFYL